MDPKERFLCGVSKNFSIPAGLRKAAKNSQDEFLGAPPNVKKLF
jgi:hypothetical protein